MSAAIEAEAIADKFREEAKQRQVEAGEHGSKGGWGNKSEILPQKIGEAIQKHKNETDHKLAETFGTNRQYIADIRKVRESEPETFEAIKQGEVKLAGIGRKTVDD